MQRIYPIDANDQLIEATLDGLVFFINLSWNSEYQGYTLALYDENSTLLVAGVHCSPNLPLLRIYRRGGFPLGELMLFSLTEDIDRLSFEEGKATLLYLTEDDLQDAGALSVYGRL